MSHALCIVALSRDDLLKHDTPEKAVAWQMKPFSENGHWFEDGSRWDWYVIGGRFPGRFLGKDICTRVELTEEKLIAEREEGARQLWTEWTAEPLKKRKDKFFRSYIYGLEEGDTLEKVIARSKSRCFTAVVFLKDRRWCEKGRMGWFGSTTKTECQRSAESESKEGDIDLATWTGRCLVKDEKTGAEIVDFTGPKDSEDRWDRLYWPRFLRPLPPETTLVAVDYHV